MCRFRSPLRSLLIAPIAAPAALAAALLAPPLRAAPLASPPLVAALVAGASGGKPAAKPDDRPPVRVVELFESRDCPACPAARTNLNALARRADVLALSYPVSFRAPADWAAEGVRPEFVARQAEYVVATGAAEVATPQMVLNGRLLLPGNDPSQLAVMLKHATAIEARPGLRQVGNVVWLDGAPPRRAAVEIWLVEYSPLVRGDDEVHRNIVRRLQRLALWSGGRTRLVLPRLTPGRAAAILVQYQDRGAIIAALEVASAAISGP